MIKEILRDAYRKVYGIVGNGRITKKIPWLMEIHGYIMNILKFQGEVIEVDGFKNFLHKERSATSAALSVLGVVEPLAVDTIKRNVKKGDAALDLGANIGHHTLILAKLVGDTGKVFAFEPAPENVALIRKSIKINNINNIVDIEKAKFTIYNINQAKRDIEKIKESEFEKFTKSLSETEILIYFV